MHILGDEARTVSGNITDIAHRVADETRRVVCAVADFGGRLFSRGQRCRHCELLSRRHGEHYWQERIGPHAHSSLVSANGLVYATTDDGTTTVIKPGPKFQVVAKNTLGEPCYSSPAISAGRVFVRGAKHLFCFGEKR